MTLEIRHALEAIRKWGSRRQASEPYFFGKSFVERGRIHAGAGSLTRNLEG